MRTSFRNLSAVFALATAVLAPASVITQGPAEWQLGDLFVGIGRFDDHPGQYLVYSPQGLQKEGLVDLTASTVRAKGMPIGVTTGCMVAPPNYADALYTTTFYAQRVMAFSSVDPHHATLAAQIDHPAIDSIESVAFDNVGNYYVGGLPPTRDSASDPAPPTAFIFKYRRVNGADVLQATYEVPNGMRGVDSIDIGTDQETFYYTSQGNKIHAFRPAGASGGAFYREIQLRYPDGQLETGTAYSLRALPPFPGDATLRPSGFLVAMHSGVLRVTYDGEIVHRYDAGNRPGQFFAMNITPDGQSFWTATFQPDDPSLPDAGYLYRFHIASGALVKGPVPVRDLAGTQTRSIWGLCVKREYTAAVNTCYQMGPDGAATLDASGNPIAIACRVPEICRWDSGDEDGDGLPDAQDPDCRAPEAVTTPPQESLLSCAAARPSIAEIWPANHQWVDVTIGGFGDAAPAIRITSISQDEPTDTTGDASTAIDGMGVGTSIARVRAERTGDPRKPGNGRVYEIQFTATAGADSCTGAVTVAVPHDQGKTPAINDGTRYDSTLPTPRR